jgi:hypothetical protein
MQIDINAYGLVIGASLVVILSYFFNIIAKKTNIPSVLLLIILGILIKQGLHYVGLERIPYLPLILELLGTVGLIFIVLEAALDLELSKEKWPIIWKSFTIAFLSLMASSFGIAWFLHAFIIDSWMSSLEYAIPLSIMSSAIVIPSVGGLFTDQKEFMIYEATFSDILGIMFFYLLIQNADVESGGAVIGSVLFNIIATVGLSLLICYALIFVLQKITSGAKLFLTIAVLLMLYGIGKIYHLSPLVLILAFGLMLNNHKLFWRGRLSKFVDDMRIERIQNDFHLLTVESAFVIRTFFFVIFGFSIILASLYNIQVVFYSLVIVLILYSVRLLWLAVFKSLPIFPLLYIAPRGLITILLFFGIPKEYQSANFDNGIVLLVIITSSLIMTFSLIQNGIGIKSADPEHDIMNDESEYGILEEEYPKTPSTKTEE